MTGRSRVQGNFCDPAAGVLQDLGFNIDESETRLGIIVASKDRSAVSGGQVAGAVILALLGAPTAIDKTQKTRVSLVARPASMASDTNASSGHLVRVTFQRIVWNTQNQVSRIESIEDALIYQEFFEKLSKSVFLEAQSFKTLVSWWTRPTSNRERSARRNSPAISCA